MARIVWVIWGNREREYFCRRGWTGQITLKPLRKFNFARTPANCPTGRSLRAVRRIGSRERARHSRAPQAELSREQLATGEVI
jgi:hypothetical protein